MVYVIVILFAMIVAVGLSVFLVYVDRLKKYMLEKRKRDDGVLLGVIDAIWRILLPVVCGVFAFLLPLLVIQWWAENTVIVLDKCTVSSTYLCSFVLWLIVSMVVAIRCGKFNISRKREPE